MGREFSWDFPYVSQRMPVFARNVVSTSQPLAAQAGLRMLLKGGNAVDAAIAAAITLTVVEPTSNGIGSDAFAMVWDRDGLFCLNGSGRSPESWSPSHFAAYDRMPLTGWDSVTVPGAVAAWADLWRRFGRLPFSDLFDPAMKYAVDGFVVSPITGRAWALAEKNYRQLADFSKAFLPDGRAPKIGERFRLPDMAETLAKIAESEGESFYRGELAQQITTHASASGGAITMKDLAEHQSDWVTPLSMEYHGLQLHEMPPNGQGIAALIAMGILRYHDIRSHTVDSVESVHLQIEAMKIAFAEAHRHVADPRWMRLPPESLLDKAFIEALAEKIDPEKARYPSPSLMNSGGTVYLTAADETGLMVSYIQSNYMGFGSGVVIPGTGISLQNRGAGFNLDEGHPNQVAGRKRPYHTIIPGFVTKSNRPLLSYGVMGGHMQPQGHVQILVRLFDFHQNPQAASDAPRWYVDEHFGVFVEKGFNTKVIDGLRSKGHRVSSAIPRVGFGGAQLVLCLDEGYAAASDHRKDGQAVGF
jgi:gamma-glutamyltranspeptidase/glutathione hydrolase